MSAVIRLSYACLQVVGCIVEHDGKVLLCKRNIEPCRGKWTVPAGFLEMDESTAGGFIWSTVAATGPWLVEYALPTMGMCKKREERHEA